MPELNYKAQWVPSKDEVKEYLDNSQLFPLNIQALGFELLKLIRRVNELESTREQSDKWIINDYYGKKE